MKDLNTQNRKKMLKKIARPEPREMNFLEAFLLMMLAFICFTIILPLLQRAADIQSLPDCELHGDCAEIIKNINNK